MMVAVSDVPAASDVLDAEIPVLTLSEVAERLGQPVTRVQQLLREGHLLAVRRERVPVVPAEFLAEDQPAVVKGLPGTLTVLHDAGFADEEILRWLFTADESLPGTPIGALRSNRGREVKRRAQALAF